VAPLIELIADPRHKFAMTAPTSFPKSRPVPSSILRLQRLTALGRDENPTN
jgi:hypothetical protein